MAKAIANRYARDQPTGFRNRIERIAIVGAGGHVGKSVTEALLKTGRHVVTALTREGSNSKLPTGVNVVRIDYGDEPSVLAALEGQQVLLITMSVFAPKDQMGLLIRAAARAGVAYVLPNAWGADTDNRKMAVESRLGDDIWTSIEQIEKEGVSAWMTISCGFWYEWSLCCGPEFYGFDFKKKAVTFYDDGNTKISTTTWTQIGRTIAALFSLKELPDDEHDDSLTVSRWSNKPVYVESFNASQKDMFESWKRVTGDEDKDWKISYQPSKERYEEGLKKMKRGNVKGFAQAMYARSLYPTGESNFTAKGLVNDILGLPKEDIDESTRAAKKWMDNGFNPM